MARRVLWSLLLLVLVAGCAAKRTPQLREGAGLVVIPNPGAATSIVTPAMRVPAWYVDPQATVSTASDNNDCQTASTPCLTYSEIARRWATYAPILAQSTTITFLSSQTTTADPIVFRPYVTSGADVILQCSSRGTQIGTGTLNAVTAKNIVAGAGASDLESTFTGTVPTAIGQLVVDTTQNSQAWVTANPSGSTWALTQPLTSAAPPLHNRCGFLAENNSWTTGDSVTIYSTGVCNLNIQDIEPIFTGGNASPPTNQLVIWRVGFFDPGNNQAQAKIGSHVQLLEDYVPFVNGSALTIDTDTAPPAGGIINTWLGAPYASLNVYGQTNGSISTSTSAYFECIYGGATCGATGNKVQFVTQGPAGGYGINVGGDFEVCGNTADVYFYSGTFVDSIVEGYGADFWFSGNTYMLSTGNVPEYHEGPQIWGIGGGRTVILIGQSKFMFRVSAANSFLTGTAGITYGTTVNTAGTGCSLCTSTWNCGISLTQANIDAACGAAGFGGKVFLAPGGGWMLNSSNTTTQ